MNARGKLNVAYFNGSIVLAIVAGILSDSCGVTVVILASGILLSLLLGNIRPSPHHCLHRASKVAGSPFTASQP